MSSVPLSRENEHHSTVDAVYASQLCLQEPSMNDFTINNDEYATCKDITVIIAWMSHTDQLISIAENDVDLQSNISDLSLLYLRKASLYSSVFDFHAAKKCAERAISLYESALGYFRLGCIQYCLLEYKLSMESLLVAERLEPSNVHVQRAILVCLARMRSTKDRIPVVTSIA